MKESTLNSEKEESRTAFIRKESMNKILIILAAILLTRVAFTIGEVYSQQENSLKMKRDVFSQVSEEARVINRVKQITYEQFMKIQNSGELYILIDVRAPANYNAGHIDGAISFFLNSINANSASQILPKGSRVITYGRRFSSLMSARAARKLADLGYDVLDYKGGYQEWRGKGNR